MRVLLATTCTPDDRKTLCAARSLARRGVRVSVGSDRFWGQAPWSAAVSRRLRYPHPAHDPAGFARQLRQHLAEFPLDFVLPTNDYTTAAVASIARALPEETHTALPDPDDLAFAGDKYAVAGLCGRIGVESPPTRLARSAPEVATAADEVGYPCVVKLRRGSGAVGLRIARGPAHLRASAPDGRRSDSAFEFHEWVVQECVPGETHDVCAVARHGELRAAVSQRRVRTYPAAGGVGIDCVTTDDPRLIERAAALLQALRWHGPAQVEFKVDPATGRAWLIEINGRLWGTLALAVFAGVDVPWMLCRMALDGDVSPQRAYRVGARYRWMLPLGLLHIAQSAAPWTALRDLAMPARDTAGDWRWIDPVPHAAEAIYALCRMWERRCIGSERRPIEAGGSP